MTRKRRVFGAAFKAKVALAPPPREANMSRVPERDLTPRNGHTLMAGLAARITDQPLLASKACKIQVLAAMANPENISPCLTANALKRRIEADLIVRDQKRIERVMTPCN